MCTALTVRTGCGKERLEQLRATLSSGERAVLSAEDLHVLHAVLLSVYSMFASAGSSGPLSRRPGEEPLLPARYEGGPIA
ncbi:hypothetical protein ABT063_20650 [Streptomyces sp. NPDC002838]|uniref:hypothetical protein n=1 Tax=Streptomyces sp. NPDC002838 TaxID=3154436 RepID=UPI00332936DF